MSFLDERCCASRLLQHCSVLGLWPGPVSPALSEAGFSPLAYSKLSPINSSLRHDGVQCFEGLGIDTVWQRCRTVAA
jgi:hypothetical protein